MADSVDVENALASLVAQTLMPTDYELGSAESSLLGPPIRLYRGWPVRKQLDDDLLAGITHITIYPRPQEVNTTRYSRDWIIVGPHQHTLTADISVVGGVAQVTFGGSITTQNVGLTLNGIGYVHSVAVGDSLDSVAAGLATSVGAPATSLGPDLLLPQAITLAVTVGGFAKASRELKRQQRNYQIVFWAPTPALRDLLVPLVDFALAEPQWLTLADGTTGRLVYHNSLIDDDTSRVGFFRRDLFYSVEYATTQTMMVPEVVLAEANMAQEGVTTTVVAQVGVLP